MRQLWDWWVRWVGRPKGAQRVRVSSAPLRVAALQHEQRVQRELARMREQLAQLERDEALLWDQPGWLAAKQRRREERQRAN